MQGKKRNFPVKIQKNFLKNFIPQVHFPGKYDILFPDNLSLGGRIPMLKKILGRIPVLGMTLALAAAGFYLRKNHLAVGFDGDLPNGMGIWPLVILLAVAAGLFLAVALKKEKRTQYAENFSSELPAMILAVLAAGLLLAGVVANALQASPAMQGNVLLTRILTLLGVVTALCFAGTAMAWNKEKEPTAVFCIVPVVYYILRAILCFKVWSNDPIILDYCFSLFAMIAALLGTFHIGNFVFSGQRRLTIFLCLTGVVFSATALPGSELPELLQISGSALWLLAGGWQVLRD